jgi:small subunit ribosomal protein S1
MSIENFPKLFEESMAQLDMRPGSVIKATVVEIRPDRVILGAGLKSEAIVSAHEFRNENIQVGDEVDVVIKSVENGFGETRLSHEEAKRVKVWKDIETSHLSGESIMGTIIERVKGGFTVEIESIRAFLPGSLVDVKPVRDPGHLEGKELEFKIIKMDQKRNNIVVSRRAAMQEESGVERSARLDELQEGQEIDGVVKNITDYGAFVDLGGIDGLLHITDMAWKRVKHPSELINVGDELRVKILKFDRDKNRVSLGLKQLGDDPWKDIAKRFPSGTRIHGKVTNITDYGCFVELEEGVEGLVHMSEMDWTNKNVHPNKIVKSGEEVEVIVLDMDEERRRISLGIKQCKLNPWQAFAEQHNKDEVIKGRVRSITDFGMFVGLEGDIDGLVHLSDISWMEPGEEVVRNYKKGDEVETIILAIDPERERISLGIKQLEDDPIAKFVDGLDKDSTIKASAVSVEQKQAVLQLNDNTTGVLRIAEYSYDRVNDLREELKVGEEIDVKVIGIDRKTHNVMVSHKALETPPDSATGSREIGDAPTKTTLGDLLREKMRDDEEKNK